MNQDEYIVLALIIMNLAAGFGFAIPIANGLGKATGRREKFFRYFVMLVGIYFVECVAFPAGMCTQALTVALGFVWAVLFGLWLRNITPAKEILKTAFFVSLYGCLPTCSFAVILVTIWVIGGNSLLNVEQANKFGIPQFVPWPFNTMLGFCAGLAIGTILLKTAITTGTVSILIRRWRNQAMVNLEKKGYRMTTVTDEKQLAACIDHTLLSATASSEQIKKLCQQARDYGFCSVFINPRWIALAAEQLHGCKVKVGSVVGFPLGADSTKIKVAQAEDCIFAGADEVDMVADLAAIIEGDAKYLSSQILSVLKVCRSMKPPVCLKVIIEAAALNKEQKIFACRIADKCGVDFVKTSTGMNPAGGATVEDVKLMEEYAPNCKIKASGGIRTAKQALELLEAGANRIGTSSGVQIINEFNDIKRSE